MKPSIRILFITLALVASLIEAAAQGTAFTYQGRLTSGTNVANGVYDLRFTIYDSSGGPTVIAGPLTNSPTSVSNGLFTVTLDFGAGVFTGAERWLDIGVRTNGSGAFTALAPRQKLTPTPYAITSGNLSGALAAAQLSGNLNAATLPTGGNWPLTSTLTVDSGTLTIDPGNNRVGIGTSTPGTALTVATGIGYGIEHTDGTRRLSTYLDEGGCWLGSVSPHPLYFFVNNGLSSMTLDLAGRIGIGTTAPSWPLHVVAGQGVVRLDSTANTFGSVIELRNNTASPAYLGAINFQNAAGTYPGQIGYLGTDDMIFRTAGLERIRVAANGNVGIGTTSPAEKLQVSGNFKTTGRVMVEMDSSSTSPQLELRETQDGDYARLRLQSGTRAYWDIAAGGGAPNVLNIYNTNYGNVVSLTPDGVLTTKVLTITGGADIAEPFKMSEANLPKGAVVVIDENNPGKLKLSTEPYDRRVAGIISGAGGVTPGLSLQQKGVVEGDQQVALTGRVHVQADTTNGAIKPGDLLTTSAKPGHAMKVTDHARAQGAILGKAMTGLKEGKGLVLVLVTLQ